MPTLVNMLNDFLVTRMKFAPAVANAIDETLLTIVFIFAVIAIDWILQQIYMMIIRRSRRLRASQWYKFLEKRRTTHKIIHLIPGIIFYMLLFLVFDKGSQILHLMHRIALIYIVIIAMMIVNSVMLSFLDIYSKTDKHKVHPMQGLVQGLQVALYFIGGIIILAILIDKSPTVLLTGLGASAAVLMLIFKDSILGFVAGVQLSQNNMIQIGDWIQMPDGSANGNVEEITLNTVKVRNWDNTLSMIPPYTLVSQPFKNWRGMMTSGGRRVDKMIRIDIGSIELCSDDMIADIKKAIPLMKDFKNNDDQAPTNTKLYRYYIESYLRHHPAVAQGLDLIIAQREQNEFGLPIEIYFFLSDKIWVEYERLQSDIFDHLIGMASEFGLKLYQLNKV